MQQLNCPPSQVIIGIVFTIFLTGECLAQENINWRNRFFDEAPKHWEDYLYFARSLQITVTGNRYTDADGKRSKLSIRSNFKQRKGACMFVQQDFEPKNKTEVEGINPSYSFKLKQRRPDRGWVIADLDIPKQSSTFSDKQRIIQEKYLQNLVCDCLMLESLWMPTLIQDPDFRITAIKTQEIDGSPVIRFDFDYPKSDKDYPIKGAGRIKGGWMVLDPDHDWILREYLVHAGQPEKYYIRQKYQIREGTGRHPIITHRTLQIVDRGEKPFESIGETEWKTEERSDVPLEEFTLTAFGLPEPPGIQVRRSPLYLWVALGGIVCLGIAALARWQIRRTRTTG